MDVYTEISLEILFIFKVTSLPSLKKFSEAKPVDDSSFIIKSDVFDIEGEFRSPRLITLYFFRWKDYLIMYEVRT